MTLSNAHQHIPVHSNKTLIKASVTATVMAVIILVLIILPAEYKVDPTGFGKAAGLTQLADLSEAELEVAEPVDSNVVKTQQQETAVPPAEQPVETSLGFALAPAQLPTVEQIKAARQTPDVRSDTIDIVIPAGKGLEYKLLIDAYVHLEYEWRTDGQPLYFDFHGEPEGDKSGYYESFAITTATEMKGSLTAPFTGSHGWYWKNKSGTPVTVTLITKGDYRVKG